MTVRPPRSMVRVDGPLSASISAVVPTLRMRPPLMASAWAIVKRSSTVTTLPLTRTVSGTCAAAANGAAARIASASAHVRPSRMSVPLAFYKDGAESASARLQAFLLQNRNGLRRGQELDQCFGGVGLRCAGMDAACEHGDLLDVRRQRSDEVDAGDRQQLAHLLEADLGVAARDDLADRDAGCADFDLVLDLIGDAHALEQCGHIDAARPGGIGDRFCRQHRLLDLVAGADVGLRHAGAHRDADPRLGEVDTAARDEFALLDELVDG